MQPDCGTWPRNARSVEVDAQTPWKSRSGKLDSPAPIRPEMRPPSARRASPSPAGGRGDGPGGARRDGTPDLAP
jgi:hypothetical protein